MSITKECETIKLLGIDLDVHYSYWKDDGHIQIEAIESLTDTQDLMPIMNQSLFEVIINMLKEIESKKG